MEILLQVQILSQNSIEDQRKGLHGNMEIWYNIRPEFGIYLC